MSARDRDRHAKNQERQSPELPSEVRASAHSGHTGVWIAKGTPAGPPSAVWLIRPMPPDQWPPDLTLPRDDSFPWLVRSACGHPGGVKLWAFYEKADAETYRDLFHSNPCHFTRCPNFMIENERRRSRG